ncbi:MAG: serine hydrolase domain-containing protein [Steroidobacteraceae bacterium]
MKRQTGVQWFRALLAATSLAAHATYGDVVDDFVRATMGEHHLIGLSLAVIRRGEVIKANGYGFADTVEKTPVTTTTLFQAGSISKSVAAVAALRLVETGKLTLDSNVNNELHVWKIPENQYTKQQHVTLRRILSHTAGLKVHGFPGYEPGVPIPTLRQVLNGEPPANTAAIRVESVPGSHWQYSGGGYAVLQEMIVDVTAEPFAESARKLVLEPAGMSSSSFDQPLPQDWAPRAATGYFESNKRVPGRWHVYPEMAAAGLWTTASDLAQFAISIRRSWKGLPGGILSRSSARLMLTAQQNNDGLGVFVVGTGRQTRFFHNGRNAGFDATMIERVDSGLGAVIMINTNDDTGAADAIWHEVIRQYH